MYIHRWVGIVGFLSFPIDGQFRFERRDISVKIRRQVKPRDARHFRLFKHTPTRARLEDERGRRHGNRDTILSAGELINLCSENSFRQH